MRRLLVLVTATTSLVLGVGAGSVAAAPPDRFDHDCRVTATQCNPGQHKGGPAGKTVPERRTLGG